MARLTADTVTRQLKKVFGDKLTLALESKTSEKVNFIVTYNKNNAQIRAFFDLQSQLYGFVMFNNGIKTYDKVDVFVEMLNVYMYINTELIPITQQIVDLYSRENGLTTKYMTFTGNLNEGFTTQFEVAGEPRFVFVTEQETNVYRLTLVESQDKKKYKTLDMYLYLRQPDGTFEKRFMILSAANKLFERCFDLGSDYTLKRTETNTFVFTYDELTVTFSLNISDSIEYVVHSVNDKQQEFSFVLDDFLDIDAFITAVLDRIGGKLGGVQGPKMPTYEDSANTEDVDKQEDSDAVDLDDIDFEDTDTSDIDNEMNALDSEIDKIDDEADEIIDSEEDTDVTEEPSTEDLFDADIPNEQALEKELEDLDSELPSEDDLDFEETNDTESDSLDETNIVSDNDIQNFEDTDINVGEFEESTNKEDNMIVENNENVVEESITDETTDFEIESKENEVESKEIADESKEIDNSDVDFSGESVVVSKLMRDNEMVGLLFNVEGTLYIANTDSLKSYRIPYKRLTNSEVEVKKGGYFVWESESKLKTFADDISEDVALRDKLVNMMF